jgi:demethylmenaquinone methyltransferase/2-methoxy-6-polyprenyl-1,4-benzoquinol methylase
MMFDGIVERYDLLNGLLSFGFDRWWRRAAAVAADPRPNDLILDLGCGTGELSARVAGATPRVRVVGLDVSAGMLAAAARRGTPRVRLVRGSAFHLPFAGGTFDAVVSGFVLRNLDDLRGAFDELARVTRPGGRLALVDVTEPPNALMRKAFDAYFGTAAPALGRMVGKGDAYRYLARSLAQLPPPEQVGAMLTEHGFERATARPLTGGMVTHFTALKA